MIRSGAVGLGVTGTLVPGVASPPVAAGVTLPRTAGVDVARTATGVEVGGLGVGLAVATGRSVGRSTGRDTVGRSVGTCSTVAVGVAVDELGTATVGSVWVLTADACWLIVASPSIPSAYSHVANRNSATAEPVATFFTSSSASNQCHRS